MCERERERGREGVCERESERKREMESRPEILRRLPPVFWLGVWELPRGFDRGTSRIPTGHASHSVQDQTLGFSQKTMDR